MEYREFVGEKILRELSAAFWRHAKLADVQHGAVGYGSSLISLRPEVVVCGKLSSYFPRKIKKGPLPRLSRCGPFAPALSGREPGPKSCSTFSLLPVVQTSQGVLVMDCATCASRAFLLRYFFAGRCADRRLPTARVQWLCNKFSRARAPQN